MSNTVLKNNKAYIITGPTSGIGKATALELAKHGTVILVGRSPQKLKEVQDIINQKGQHAVSVVCDLSDIVSAQRAAEEIMSLGLPIAGLLNNAGISPTTAGKSSQGYDLTFATNYLGPFAFTEALIPHLPDGANVVFIASAVEDPERKPAKVFGMKGGRYISAEASARGEWKQGGTKLPGADAYATSKQCVLAASMTFAREIPRLHFNAVEPGITPGTGLGGDANFILRFLFGQIMTLFPPFAQYRSTPQKAAQLITKLLIDAYSKTGIYYDEKGKPMLGSELVRNAEFQDRVVSETRAFLSKVRVSA
ncbi:SDR family NAD(P)-dependent oxidoreductase [Mucilaginibacter lappiensis]|uniref:NAD(P)-dependent dehydrogenase (Short-subunit alcohol dehydrogenase family) n=1 Tax=Mucilaginibacter lappiensis TaxID=354630 RepID=A0A841JDL6_9SPHI|nr:SDR family NAD(P)-dependent oxidoreductase [Mucilaginibacter lappiensis]MBB6128694.1 NAD(P)-dependent dehydrogenase (short-subunit alcohol dehydrogenase family) [Mucilaginibacter lappiensis]